ncbi:MAG: nickel pincer cofactor biosynthesis protein LarB [Gemmatimonadaceae bacterium]|nr:nickel pincer cofactor biosynthesis protein LarB [Gemmatimonadaceae bacterium]
MNRAEVHALLDEIAAGRVSAASALDRLTAAPLESFEFATVDHHRALRQGYPEVVYGEGKTVEQTLTICAALAERSGSFLVTRTDPVQRAALAARFPAAVVHERGRIVELARADRVLPAADARLALVITAGTTDLPVADEAALTLTAFGQRVERLTDVGVAGLHRLLANHELLQRAAVVIVVAGMDGALPSVVGGLVRVPVIAVPTSVGYGAAFHGLAPLLTMLNSCAAGVTVCNIDNGFGAAVAAARILGG